MSLLQELIPHLLERMERRPERITVHVPIDDGTRSAFERHHWSRQRWQAQQQSILQLSPDDPLYGLGLPLLYRPVWEPHPGEPTQHQLRFELVPGGAATSPRELILFTSTRTFQVPFPYGRGKFQHAKNRMLGKEAARLNGISVLYEPLRAAVANVRWKQVPGQGAAIYSATIDEILSED
jgi:hypothetical protein